MVNKAHAFARDELVRTLTSYTGIATADGAADGTTLIDSNLIGRNDFITEKTILIVSGPTKDEDKGALSFDNGTGTITLQGTGFSAQIKAGTIFKVLNISTVEIDVANINAKIGSNTDPSGTTTLFARLRQIVDDYLASASVGLTAIKNAVDAEEGKLDDGTYGLSALKALIDAIEAKLDSGTSGLDAIKALIDALEMKLDRIRGESPTTGSVTGNWQSGTGTSGETGANLVTIGTNDTKYKLHSLIVSIHNLQLGALIKIKLFQQVNGTQRKVYEEQFQKGTDPDGCWVVNGTVGIHEALRVEVGSNRAADNGLAIDYDYMLEAM